MRNKLIEKFIKEQGIEHWKNVYINKYEIISTDLKGETMIILNIFEDILIYINGELFMKYRHKYCTDNEYHFVTISDYKEKNE